MPREIDDRRASGRSARSSSRPATRSSRCPTATRSSARSERSTSASRSTSTSTRPTGTPTTSCPPTTWLERDDIPLAFLGFYTTPFVQHTDAVVPPRGRGARGVGGHREIAAAARDRGAVQRCRRCAARAGSASALRPQRLLDLLVRTGPKGDWFGLRARPELEKLRAAEPHGVVTDEHIATGVLRTQGAPPRRARPPRPARRSSRSSAARAPPATPTRPSRCGSSACASCARTTRGCTTPRC